jgi:hypothetical protein
MKTSAWKTKSSCIAGFALALTCLSEPSRAQEKSDLRLEGPPLTRYIVTDLGPIGPPPAQPFALSASGFVSGEAVLARGTGSVSHAVIWKGRSMTDISSPGMGGPNSAAFGVNVWGPSCRPSGHFDAGSKRRRLLWFDRPRLDSQRKYVRAVPFSRGSDECASVAEGQRGRQWQQWASVASQQARSGGGLIGEYDCGFDLPGAPIVSPNVRIQTGSVV